MGGRSNYAHPLDAATKAASMRLILAALLLSGCSLLPTRTVVTVNCPALKTYTAEFQTAQAKEMRALVQADSTPDTITMIVDYKALRDAVRACREPVQ